MTKRSILIIGLARQGIALARYLVEKGERVVVTDARDADKLEAALMALHGLDITYVLGSHPSTLLDNCKLVYLSGGVPLTIPIVVEARRRGIPLSNDAQYFMERCPAPTVGITGSAGKTTTTTLVGLMLKHAGFSTWVGGNIGNPLISDLDAIQPDDRVVMELSSFQLELMTTSPGIAAVLNITPNHLDRHKTMDAYIAAKRNIVAHQSDGDIAVLGFDESNAKALSSATPAEKRYFSIESPVAEGAYLKDQDLVLVHDGEEAVICQRDEIKLRGAHNVLNTLAAATLAYAAGAPLASIRAVAMTFTGVPHRLEPVRSLRGVQWVNDSIATAPERVLAALTAFDEPLVLLAGGKDKDLPWDVYAKRVVQRVRAVVLFGAASELIEANLREALSTAEQAGTEIALKHVVPAGNLEQAVDCAADLAANGDVVLLSPGGTSYDAFKDFEERGELFRQLVNALI